MIFTYKQNNNILIYLYLGLGNSQYKSVPCSVGSDYHGLTIISHTVSLELVTSDLEKTNTLVKEIMNMSRDWQKPLEAALMSIFLTSDLNVLGPMFYPVSIGNLLNCILQILQARESRVLLRKLKFYT